MIQKRFNALPDAEEAKILLQGLSEQSSPDPCRLVDRPLVLYGAGNLGRMAKSYFERINIKVEAVVDQGAENYQDDCFWTGIPVIHPDSFDEEQKQQVLLAVCIANISYATLERDLCEKGWQAIAHFYDIAEAYREQHPLSNGWFCVHLSSTDCAEIAEVIQGWHDDLSRAYHLQFIAWRHLRQEWLFFSAAMMLDNRYLIPEVSSVLDENEFFVDAGGHQGETSCLLLEAVNFKFSGLLVFKLSKLFSKLSNERNPFSPF